MTRIAATPIPGFRHRPRASAERSWPGAVRATSAAPTSSASWSRAFRVRLTVTDIVLVALACAVPAAYTMLATGGTARIQWVAAAVISVVWVALLFVFRTRESRLLGVGAGEYKQVANATALTFGLLAVAFVAADVNGIRTAFLSSLLIGGPALLTGRWLWRKWLTGQRRFGHYLSRVIVAGPVAEVRYVVEQLHRRTGAAYRVVGVAIDGARQGELPTDTGPVQIVSDLDGVTETVERLGADTVIVADHTEHGSTYIRDLGWQLEGTATELVVASSLTNIAGPRIHLRPIEGLPLMHVELPQYSGAKHSMKRLLDLVGSGLGLLVLLPALIVIGVLVRVDSSGPALFRQERVGRDGTTFRMLKFRSMVQNAEAQLSTLTAERGNDGAGVLFKLKDDPRVTRLGRFLRATSIDELPQLWNVFTGSMSLVGPRPPLPGEVSQYEDHVHRRLYIKPGLTGMWQINGRSDLSWEESVRLDLYYVENWSLATDLVILWRTAKVFVRPRGAY